MEKNSRGAYAQVTAPIGDDTHVTVKQGGKGQGTGAFCTRTRLIGAVLVAVIIIIIIIIVAVVVSKNNKSETIVQGTTKAPSTTKEMVPSSPPLSQSSMTDAMTTTTQPPMPTTFGPAVIGSFSGSLVFQRPYVDSFDDIQLQATVDFMRNISSAIAQVFDPNAPYMYHSTEVDRLLKNGTDVAAEFTVSVDAIDRGASDHLRDTIGQQGYPSTILKTYPVRSAEIRPEEATATGA